MGILVALCIGVVGTVRGQSPSYAVESALETLTGGVGNCVNDVVIKDTTIAYFPRVRFIRRYCTAEHGNPASGIVALDSDSVLYLLGSTDALAFLLARHPIRQLDSASVLLYAPVALELTGVASGYSRIVRDPREGGDKLVTALNGRSWQVIPMGIPRATEWALRFGRVEPAYQGQWAYLTSLWIRRDGVASMVRDSLLTPLPNH